MRFKVKAKDKVRRIWNIKPIERVKDNKKKEYFSTKEDLKEFRSHLGKHIDERV